MSKLGVAVLEDEVKPHEVVPIRRHEWVVAEDRYVSWRGLVDADTLLSEARKLGIAPYSSNERQTAKC